MARKTRGEAVLGPGPNSMRDEVFKSNNFAGSIFLSIFADFDLFSVKFTSDSTKIQEIG
jgi:hypothetical protein